MLLEVDKEGKIHNIGEDDCEIEDLQQLNTLLYKNKKNEHYYIAMNKKIYNKITKYGRMKTLGEYERLFIDYYSSSEYDSMWFSRMKTLFKRHIYSRFLSLFKKVVIYTDVIEIKELARKEGLDFAKKLNEAKAISPEATLKLIEN